MWSVQHIENIRLVWYGQKIRIHGDHDGTDNYCRSIYNVIDFLDQYDKTCINKLEETKKMCRNTETKLYNWK